MEERWKLSVTGEERIYKIFGIVELTHSVKQLDQIFQYAKEVESSVFESSSSKDNYLSTMDKTILIMKKMIEDEAKGYSEKLAARSIQESMENRLIQIKEELGRSIDINKDYNDGDDDEKRIKELLLIEKKLLEELWGNQIGEQMEKSRQLRQKQHVEYLKLLLENMQLQQFVVANHQLQEQQNLSSVDESKDSAATPASTSSSFKTEIPTPTPTPPPSSSSSTSSSYSCFSLLSSDSTTTFSSVEDAPFSSSL